MGLNLESSKHQTFSIQESLKQKSEQAAVNRESITSSQKWRHGYVLPPYEIPSPDRRRSRSGMYLHSKSLGRTLDSNKKSRNMSATMFRTHNPGQANLSPLS